MSKLYYISEDYKPKGAIEGYPLKVADRMIHEQVKQGNEPDVEVFEKMAWATKPKKGFDWHLTKHEDMWSQIYQNKYFDLFFHVFDNEHITQEEYDEVNGREKVEPTYLKTIEGIYIDFDEKQSRQKRLRDNKILAPIKKLDSLFFDQPSDSQDEINYFVSNETMNDLMKGSIKDEFEKIPVEAKDRVEKAAREYDYINPDHYKSVSKEVWEMMVDIWGPEKFIAHCEMTAFKYRMRLGKKPNQPIERDLEKAKWYENKAKEVKK